MGLMGPITCRNARMWDIRDVTDVQLAQLGTCSTCGAVPKYMGGLIVSAMRALCLSGAVGGARIYILQKQCEAWTIYRIASISAPLLPVYIIDYHYIIIPYVSFVLLSAAPHYSA